MTRLTEEMVIARSKQSDLNLIKKLNCWGSDISDVSIIKRMRGVEVLALSLNKISTLQPFEDCIKLQELYLRKNNIQDINEIVYLQNLPNLKYLWLAENPCCDRVGSNYRSIVLRALPHLKKLDNIEVTPEEVDEALKSAASLSGGHGGGSANEESYEDAYDSQHQPHHHQQHEQQQSLQNKQNEQQPHHHKAHYKTRRSSSPLKERSPDTDQESSSGGEVVSNGGVGVSGGSGYGERIPIPPSTSTHSMKDYYQVDRPQYPNHYRHSQSDLAEWDDQLHTAHHQQQPQHNSQLSHNQYGGSTATLHHTPLNRRNAGHDRTEITSERYISRTGGSRDSTYDEDEERSRPRKSDARYLDVSSTVSTAVLNHYANFHRRPINRTSNLLSATLCLVKELDYPSLEVVEHAVRCRIDELSAE